MLIIEKILLLKNSDIFKACKEVDLIDIASICTENYFNKGVTIFKKEDPGNCMYFIYKGKIRIHDGPHTLAELDDNEIVGELSVLDAESRSASATTMEECILLKLEQESFYEIIMSNASVLKGILKTLCKRLRETNIRNTID